MTVISRVRFNLADDGDVAHAVEAFAAWVTSTGVDLEVGTNGRQEAPPFTLISTSGSAGQLSAVRYSLEEELPAGRRSTSLVSLTTENSIECWIEDEWLPNSPGLGSPEPNGSVALVAAIVSSLQCNVGVHRLLDQPQLPPIDGISALADALTDGSREVPIVLMSQDRYSTIEATLEKAQSLQALIVGAANVMVLSADVGDAFSKIVEDRLSVGGGALKLIFPVEEDAPSPANLRIPGTVFLRDPLAAGRRLVKVLSHREILKPLPTVYTDEVVYWDGFPRARSSADAAVLLEQLIGVEDERNRLTCELEDARQELDFGALQLEESEKLLDSALARVRFLEARLRAAGDFNSAAESTPPPMLPETADTCLEALGLARQYLSFVDVGAADSPAGALDSYAKSPAWAKKAWRAFRAMEDYADLKETEGFDGDFLAYCTAAPSGRTTIPPTWIAMKESESTDNNPKYRSARTFPVPDEVNVDGEVYMPAHVKLEVGGRPAPRIHFFDDTSGPSSSVHVGYFGPHLPNSGTN